MKVYVVTDGSYDDFHIEAVVSRERDALLKSLEFREGGFDEWEVDTNEAPNPKMPLFIASVFGVLETSTTRLKLFETFGQSGARLGYGSTDKVGWSTKSAEEAQNMFALLQKRIERIGKDEYAFKGQYAMGGVVEYLPSPSTEESITGQPKASKENPQMND